MAETPPTPTWPAPPTWSTTLAVFLGGALGTGCRHTAQLLLPASGHATWLIVNSLGCFLLGYATERSQHHLPAHHWLPRTAPWWGTGLLGSFTTYSAVAAIAAHPGWLIPHLLAGVAAAILGITAAGARASS